MRPLIRCMWGDDCRKRLEGTCTFIHPDEVEYQNSKESKLGKRSNVENAYIAEAKTGSFNSWDKPRTRPQPVDTSTRRPNGDGGSHSRSNSGYKPGTQAAGATGGWAGVEAGAQRRSSGQVPDRPDALNLPSTLWPASWDTTPAPSGPMDPPNDFSSGWANKTVTAQSPNQQSSGGWVTSGWSSISDPPADNIPVTEDKDNDNPWASSTNDDSVWGVKPSLADSEPTPTKPPLPTRKPKVSSSLVHLIPADTKTTAADCYKGPEGRQQLYEHLIRVMIATVSIYSRKKKAETHYYQVKAMAQSPQYGRGTRQTRAILDTTLAEAKRGMTNLQNTLTENLEELAIIPDFSEEKPKKQDPRKLMRKVIGYTEELQEWFQGLDLETRTSAEEPLTVPKKLSEKEVPSKSATPPNVLASSISTPSTPSPSALTPQDLYDRGNWTWKEVKESLALIQTRLQEVEEEIHSTLYTTFNDEQAREDLVQETDAIIEELTGNLESEDEDEDEEDEEDERDEEGELEDEQAREARLIGRMEAYRDRFLNALSHIYQANEEVDNEFRNDIVELSQLVRTSNEMKQEIGAWRIQRQELESFCNEANGKLSEMESWNVQADDKLDSLKKKAQHLALMKEEITQPQQPVAPSPELDFDTLVEHIRPILLQRVHHELQPALQGIRGTTNQYQQDMIVKIDHLVQPALRRTNELCAKAIAAKNQTTTSM